MHEKNSRRLVSTIQTEEMDKPAVYHKAHQVLKNRVGEVIKTYSSKMQWRPDGGDVVFDIGTGPGDVSMNYIYPMMPANFGKLVFSDISADMLEFTKSYYGSPEKCEYKVFNVATKMVLPSELEGQCDHVTSMLVMHWIRDHRTALKNMFNLLRPEGGDCLMVFMSTNSLCDAYEHMKKSKWSEYIKDADRYISPLHDSEDPRGEFSIMMQEVGFSNIDVTIEHKTLQYDSVEHMKDEMTSVCGTLNDIPIALQSEFMDDFVAIMSEYATQSENLQQKYSKSTITCDLIVAYGQRAPVKDDSNCNK